MHSEKHGMYEIDQSWKYYMNETRELKMNKYIR